MDEAARIARLLIEYERRPEAINMAEAIYRAETRWHFARHTLQRLRYKSRELDDVRASTLDGLRCAYEDIYEIQRERAAAELEIEQVVRRRHGDDLLDAET